LTLFLLLLRHTGARVPHLKLAFFASVRVAHIRHPLANVGLLTLLLLLLFLRSPCYNHPMAELGKTFLGIGLILVALGAVLLLSARLGLPFGRLPGDLHWRSRSGHTQVYFPLATSILLSIFLSLILWLLRSFRK
jgi:hypothetical protein